MKLRYVIADDEPLARARLRTLAAAESCLSCVGEAADGAEALRLIREQDPDIAFLDIEMNGPDGLAVARELGEAQRPLTVFTTAHADYAVAAFEANVVDYLLKPFDRARFRTTITRLRELLAARRPTAPGLPQSDRLLVKSQGRYVVVSIAAIEWIESAANYVILHVDGAKHVLRSSLADVLAELKGHPFFRLGRSHAVNLNSVQEVRIEESGQHRVHLRSGVNLRLQRSFRELQQALETQHRQAATVP